MATGSPTRRRRKEPTATWNGTPDHDLTAADHNRVPLGASPAGPSEPIISKSSSRHEHKKRSRRKQTDEPSFVVLVIKVAAVLACLCVVVYGAHRALSAAYRHVYPLPETADFDDDAFSVQADVVANEQQQHLYDPEFDKLLQEAALDLQKEQELLPLQPPTVPPVQPLPHLNVSDRASQTDAYGMAERFTKRQQRDEAAKPDESRYNNHTLSQQLATFWRAARALRDEFAEHYGGENAARYILEHGLDRFLGNQTAQDDHENIPSSLLHTACRIRQAQAKQQPFRFVFGGYSVTNGRGNYFSQSYPFVMEQLLHTPFYLLGVHLEVANHAIGGCPSFPYGWCLTSFMGMDADVISWDFSMNEAGGDPTGLEAYIRQALTQLLPQRPMLIVKDTPMATQRREMLQQYQTLLGDPLLLVSDAAADYFLEQLPMSQRPSGFGEWRKFGAPLGAPGQVVHHPGVKEHEFIGWILTMHFLSILELVAGLGNALECPPASRESKSLLLPRPLALEATQTNLTKPWSGMFFGHPSNSENANNEWSMNRIHCRTTFEPTSIKGTDLSELIVVGSVAENVNVMLPKSKMFYNRGWVLDMSDQEKKSKRKLDLYGGLGFIDSKKAYYGLYTSKALRLLLPYDGNQATKAGDIASSYFRSVVVCEVNEKREFGACDASKDISFTVGGANATAIVIDKTVFMGKKICLYLPVPETAVLSTRAIIKDQYARPSGLLPPQETDEERMRDAKVGLEVQLRVVNRHIMSLEKACSVSHVIWEEATASGIR